MVSTNRTKFRDSKAAGPQVRQPTALPCPPYALFSWTAVVGCRTGDEGDAGERLLHLPLPTLPFRGMGTTSPTRKDYRSHDGFFAARSADRVSLWKRKAPTRVHAEA